jgi:hypothetical protein
VKEGNLPSHHCCEIILEIAVALRELFSVERQLDHPNAPSSRFHIPEEAMQGWNIMSADEIKGPPHLFAVLGTPQRLLRIQTLAKNKYTVLHN